MTAQFQFGLVVRGQAEQGEDISRRFQETLAIVRLADRLGFELDHQDGALQRVSISNAAACPDAGAPGR